MSKEVILKNLNEIQELVNDDKKFKYKSIVNFNCENIKEELESIDNANPSEALKELNIIRHLEIGFDKNGKPITLNDTKGLSIIKNALLKAQEPKHYLKWEDLEKDRIYKVLLNGIQYELVKRYDDYECHCDYITLQKKPSVSIFIYEYEKEIFNDLHLEMVEE